MRTAHKVAIASFILYIVLMLVSGLVLELKKSFETDQKPSLAGCGVGCVVVVLVLACSATAGYASGWSLDLAKYALAYAIFIVLSCLFDLVVPPAPEGEEAVLMMLGYIGHAAILGFGAFVGLILQIAVSRRPRYAESELAVRNGRRESAS